MIVWLKSDVYKRLRPKDPHERAWMIVQADWIQNNPDSPYTIIAPITSRKSGDPTGSGSKNVYATPPLVKEPSFILCGEIQTVEIADIERAVNSKLPKKIVDDLVYALQSVLDL
jgi:hypothetical protein